MQPRSEQRPTLAAALILAGSILAIAGVLLDWHVLSGQGGGKTFKGTDTSAGLGTIGLAGVAAIFGIVLLVRGARTGGRGSSITAVVLTAIALLASAYSAFAPQEAITQFEANDVSETIGVSESEAKALLEQAFDAGTLEATAEVGTYVSAGGSLLALIGGVLGIMYARERRRAQAAGPPEASTPYTPPPSPGP